MPFVRAAVLLGMGALLAGCGGGDQPSPDSGGRAAPAHYVSATEVQRDLGNGFRQGLYRVAVMSQKGDDAVDLGQPLPTGLLDRVRCAPTAPRPAGASDWSWRCLVRWSTVDRRAARTRYDVLLQPTGCFSAGAVPARPPILDATIRSFAEDPLNAIVSASDGC